MAMDRGIARRQAFLEAARVVFLEFGYEAASVNEVVRRAGGSLATLYAHYGNKQGLFLAVAQYQHELFFREGIPTNIEHLPIADGLQRIGEQFLRTLLLPANIDFYRLLVGEGRKFPQLLSRYVIAATDNIRNAVSAYLRARIEAGDCSIGAPDTAASVFLEMLRSHYHYRCLCEPGFYPSDEQFKEHVEGIIDIFLNGVGKRP